MGLEAIGDALREIRPIQIRNVATIGGEVCISVPIVDLPTALLACGASLRVLNPEGTEYSTNLENFYIDAFLTKLKYGEIVKEVPLPKKSEEKSAFVKIGRTAYDFNLINAAVSLSTKGDGKLILHQGLSRRNKEQYRFAPRHLRRSFWGNRLTKRRSWKLPRTLSKRKNSSRPFTGRASTRWRSFRSFFAIAF